MALAEFLALVSLEALQAFEIAPRLIARERLDRVHAPVAPVARDLLVGKLLAHFDCGLDLFYEGETCPGNTWLAQRWLRRLVQHALKPKRLRQPDRLVGGHLEHAPSGWQRSMPQRHAYHATASNLR